MRKIILAVLFILALQPVKAVTLSLVNPSQYPLQSNQGITLSVLAYNPELTQIDDLKIGLELSYPYLGLTGESYEKRIGDVAATTSAYSSFRIRTTENVPEGEYPIRVYHCTGTCTSKTYKDISLQFSGTSDIRLVGYEFSDETIVPEKEFELTILIKNFGTGKIRDASVQVNNSIQGIIPLIFKEKPNNYYIGGLESNTTYSLTYKIIINNELTDGVYLIPVMVNTPTTNFHIGDMILELNSKSEITIPLVETEPTMPILGQSLNVIATLENIGPGDAKSVVATLEKNSKVIGANYIGKIESGDDDIALFDITQDSVKEYVIRITYTDDLGVHEVTKTFVVDYKVVMDFSLLQNLITLGIIAVIVFVVYKKKFAKKKKEK